MRGEEHGQIGRSIKTNPGLLYLINNMRRKFITVLIFISFVYFVCAGIAQCRSNSYPFEKLAVHRGKIEKITVRYYIQSGYKNTTYKDSILHFTLENDPSVYSISFFNPYFKANLQVGDSVQAYTKNNNPSFIKIMVANQDGSKFRSASSNEVLHLVKPVTGEIMLNYAKQQSLVKGTFWLFLIFALILLVWLLFRLSGIRSLFSWGS